MVFDMNTRIIATGDHILDETGRQIIVNATKAYAANSGGK